MTVEMISHLLEALMILCFGLSWPLSIYKSWTSRTAKGKKDNTRPNLEGCITGLRRQQENPGQTPQETGLMICHQKLIDDYMGRFRLVRRKPVANRHKTNHKAYMTGVDDGRHISLSRQLKDNTFKRIRTWALSTD